jgi:EF-P beta-lysylation protein EpmB
MITGIQLEQHRPDWQRQMAEAISEPAELLRMLDLDADSIAVLHDLDHFRLKVPLPFVQRMRKGDPNDPLLRQVLPLSIEMTPGSGFLTDPVGDLDAMTVPGLLHKYSGRALLVVTGACAVHCRYCFRRHFPYAEANPGRHQWSAALDYLHSHPNIHEIILSGGDPLSLPDSRLLSLIDELEAIPHLQRLRIHTRLPVVIPDRVSTELLKGLEDTRFDTAIVVHINHAQEIDTALTRSLQLLRQTGAILLNQAVLLRDINDTPRAQIALSERLFACGVLPYYLHVLDRVLGAAHFDVAEPDALELYETMRRQLPGYLLPRLVRETSGEPYKSPVLSS